MFFISLLTASMLFYSEEPGPKPPQLLQAETRQGQFVQLRLELGRKRPPESVKVVWGKNEPVPCYPEEGSGKRQLWSGFMAIPADAPPGKGELIVLVDGGTLAVRPALTVKETQFPVIALKLSKETKELYKLPGREEELKRIRGALKTETPARFWSVPFAQPVNGQPDSPYGEKRSIDGKPKPGYHRGADIEAPLGEPVHSINHGRVLLAGSFIEEGNMVMIDHGQGLISAYLHLSKIDAKEGQIVKPGEKIGEVGSTGISTSNHLHLGIYLHGTPIDPLYWLLEANLAPPAPKNRR